MEVANHNQKKSSGDIMKNNSPEAQLVEDLKHLYEAESKLVEILPEMAKATDDKKLRAGFEKHLKATRSHVERLAKMLKRITVTPVSQSCRKIQSLLEEGEKTIRQQSALFTEFMGHDDVFGRLQKI
jgi:ferritin-like metal-binding protein YciE